VDGAYVRRFFVLCDHTLTYFKSRDEYERKILPKGALTCTEESRIVIEDEQENGDGFCFRVIEGSGRVTECKCDSVEKRQAWVERLQAAMMHHKVPVKNRSLREFLDDEAEDNEASRKQHVWRDWKSKIVQDRYIVSARNAGNPVAQLKFFLSHLTAVEKDYAEDPREDGGIAIHPRSSLALMLALTSGICLLYTLLLVPFALAFFWNLPFCEVRCTDAVPTHTHTHKHARAHTHTHTRTHTHTHTPRKCETKRPRRVAHSLANTNPPAPFHTTYHPWLLRAAQNCTRRDALVRGVMAAGHASVRHRPGRRHHLLRRDPPYLFHRAARAREVSHPPRRHRV